MGRYGTCPVAAEVTHGRVTEFSVEDRGWGKEALQELHLHGVCRVECLQTCFHELIVIISLKVLGAVHAYEFEETKTSHFESTKRYQREKCTLVTLREGHLSPCDTCQRGRKLDLIKEQKRKKEKGIKEFILGGNCQRRGPLVL